MTAGGHRSGLLYLAGHLVTLAANVAALVALTRLFQIEDFGRLSLASSAVVIAASVCCLGLPQAAVRYLDEYRREHRLGTLYASILTSGAVLGAIGALMAFAVRVFLPVESPYRVLIVPGAIIVFLSTVNEVVLGLYRGWEKAALYNTWLLIRRLGGVLIGIALVTVATRAPETYLWGLAIGEAFALVPAAVLLRRLVESSPFRVDLQTAVSALRYGAPFVIAIAAGLVLNLADRYMIVVFAGERAVALYVVAFGIATALASVLTRPMNLFLFPASMSRWSREGQAQTEGLLSKAADWYIFLSAPLVIVAAIASPWMVSVTATSRFADAAYLVPLLLCVFLLNGFISVASAGLYLQDRSGTLGIITAAAALGNIVLNVILVPTLGAAGAAVAGLVANAAYILATLAAGQGVRVRVSTVAVSGYAALAGVAFLFSQYVPRHSAISVIASVAVGLTCYMAGAVVFSSRKRTQISNLLASTRTS